MLYTLNEALYGPPKGGKSMLNNLMIKETKMAKKPKKPKKPGRNYTNGQGPRCGKCGKLGHYRVTCKAA